VRCKIGSTQATGQHGLLVRSIQNEEVRVKNKIMGVVALVIVVFLAGFLPSYTRARHLGIELREARREQNLAQLRDLVSLAYFEANQKDYGLAASTTTRFFDSTRRAANQDPDASVRKLLEDLLSLRDPITAGLAKGEPGVLNDLQALFVKTRQATALPSPTKVSE
jgi:hypothetical protein